MTAALSDTELLAKSCLESAQYPKNLIRPGIPQHHLDAYHDRLNQHSPRLFRSDGDSALDIWDFDNDASDFRPTVASGAVQLRARLEGSHLFSHADSKCRFLFIHGSNSRSRLNTSREMLANILTRYQVMPAFLDFVFPFGQQDYLQDFYFSGFRAETRLSPPTRGPEIPILGRSGRDMRLCYNLKSVETSKDRADKDCPWSIRQTAIYHSFDVEAGSTIWVIVKGNQVLQNRVQAATSEGHDGLPDLKSFDTPAAAFASTLATHLTFVDWCSEEWRWYLNYLENTLQDATRRLVAIPIDIETNSEETDASDSSLDPEPNPRESASLFRSILNLGKRSHPATAPILPFLRPKDTEEEIKYTFRNIQLVQDLEEKANKVKSVLDANIDILTSLSLFYRSTTQSPSFPASITSNCLAELRHFEDKISDVLTDLHRQKLRAQTLQHLLSDRKGLLYGILNRKSIESNKLLTEKSAASTQRMESMTKAMHQIAVKTQQATVSMRIITLVTLFFLPGTFISTFMSTDIISFTSATDGTENKGGGGGGGKANFRREALKFYLEITLPCMALTFAAWWGMYLWARRKERVALQRDSTLA